MAAAGFRALQLVSQRPIRTPGVEGIEDQVAAFWIVEFAYKVHRRVVNDGALSALLDLAQELPDGGRLAASGVAHQHDVTRLKAARNLIARPERKPLRPSLGPPQLEADSVRFPGPVPTKSGEQFRPFGAPSMPLLVPRSSLPPGTNREQEKDRRREHEQRLQEHPPETSSVVHIGFEIPLQLRGIDRKSVV